MAAYPDVAKRWTEITLGSDARPLKAERMPVRGSGPDAKIYSYGSHFELARLVTEEDGSRFYLLNGDTYSVTTARHQREVRSACHATGLPVLIVPHSALESAGVDFDSIQPVQIEDERHERHEHRVTVPGLAKLAEDVTSGRFGWEESGVKGALRMTREMHGADGAKYAVQVFKRGYDYGATPPGFADYDPPRVYFYRHGAGLKPEGNDVYTYETYTHFLGASVFRAKVRYAKETRCPKHGPTLNPDGSILSHWCDVCGMGASDSGYVRKNVTRSAYFVSGFDETGSGRALYFLAELPRVWDDPAHELVKPASVSDALRYLMPAYARDAAALGLDVKRQGDIFAVPVPGIAKRLPIPFRYAERGAPCPLDGTQRHIATELVMLTSLDGKTIRVFARGTLTHTEHKRIKLEGWHELVRNTVPVSDTMTRGYATHRPMLAGTPRAWSISGRVD